MNKNNKKLSRITKVLIFFIIFSLGSITVFAYSQQNNPNSSVPQVTQRKEEPNILEKSISALIRGLGWTLYNTILSDEENTADSLIFNSTTESSKHLNLSLLRVDSTGRPDPLANFLLQYYNIFQYLGFSVFIAIGSFVAIYFRRLGDNPQRISQLKDVLRRWFFTIVLMVSMPFFLDIILKINSILVDIFRTIGTSVLTQATNNSTVVNATSKGLLVEAFKVKAETDKDILSAIVYLMSAFFNVYLLFYYYMRDITISILFILFPLLAAFYPFKKDMVGTWFKNMCANIFTQAVQALLYSIVLGATVLLPSSFRFQLFTLTLFSMLIPMTEIIKRLFGIDGDIGGAKSMAGVGALIGAVTLASNMARMGKQRLGSIKEGASEFLSASTSEKNIKKNVTSLETDLNSSKLTTKQKKEKQELLASNKKQLEELNMNKRLARNKIVKNSTGLAMGSYVGINSAIGGSVFGTKSAALLGSAGSMIGMKTGDLVGSGVNTGLNLHDYNSDTRAIKNLDTNRSQQENVDTVLGLNDSTIQNTEFGKKTQKALNRQRFFKTMGMPVLGDFAYSSTIPKNVSDSQLSEIKDLNVSMSNERSIFYTENPEGQVKIHAIKDGDPSLKENEIKRFKAEFNNGKLEPSDRMKEQLKSQAANTVNSRDLTKEIGFNELREQEYNKELKTYAKKMAPLQPAYIESKKQAEEILLNKTAELKDSKYNELKNLGTYSKKECQSMASDYAKNLAKFDNEYLQEQNIGTEILNNMENEIIAQNGIDNPVDDLYTNATNSALRTIRSNQTKTEYQKLYNDQMGRIQEIRNITGMNNMNLKELEVDFNDKSNEMIFNPSTQQQLLNKVKAPGTENIDVGRVKETLYKAPTVQTLDSIPQNSILNVVEGKNNTSYYLESANGYQQCVAVGEGNSSLGNSSINYGQAIYVDGGVYQDKDNFKYTLEGTSWQHQSSNNTTSFNPNIVPNLAENIAVGTDVTFIPVIQDNGEGYIHGYDVANNSYMGSERIPTEHINDFTNGMSIHVTRDMSGSYQNHYQGVITQRDEHMIKNADYSSSKSDNLTSTQRIQAIDKKKEELETLLKEINSTHGVNSNSTLNNDERIISTFN